MTRFSVAAAFAACLTACASTALPNAGLRQSPANATHRSPRGTATVIFTLKSSGGTLHEGVRPSYVSRKTRYIFITLDNAEQGERFPCNASKANYHCRIVLQTIPGRTLFSVIAYDDSADRLAEAKFVRQLKAGTNAVYATMHGIVGSVELSLASPYYTAGKPLKQELIVTALDYTGAAIVGPDSYDHPIVVKNSDKSGSTKLSRTVVTSPADRVYVAYTGHGCGHAVLSVNYSHTTLEPAIFPTASYAIPSRNRVSGSNVVVGQDGAVWFGLSHAVASVSTNGVIRTYPIAASSFPVELALGPDGHIWFATADSSSETDGVDRVNDDGSITPYPLPAPPSNRWYNPPSVISGPQNDLWVSYGYAIYSLTAAGTYAAEYSNGTYRFDSLAEMPNGDIWMRSNTGGKYSYAPGGSPQFIAGPIENFRGSLFVNAQGTSYVLALSNAVIVDAGGHILKQLDIPGPISGSGVAVGAGSMWIPGATGRPAYQSIGRLRLSDNASCSYVVAGKFGKQYVPVLAAIGSDGNLWFAAGGYVAKASIPSM